MLLISLEEQEIMSTYSQVFLHIVFSVQNRSSLIGYEWREQLYKYMIAIIQKHKHKVYTIGGTGDHVHILISQNINHSIPNLMMELKRDSTKWINQSNFLPHRFDWQEGYGTFSSSKSSLKTVIEYIKNQEEHHKKHTSFDEYKQLLDKYEIEYNDKYLY